MKMKRRGAPFTTSFCTLFLVCAETRAEPVLPDAYRQAIEQGVQSGAYQSVAVGWIEGKERHTWFFGSAQADSAFEIGAVTEVFSGLLLAQAAYEGKLRLQTPIREVLPADFPFADSALGAVTLAALATHHAGLPAMPPNLMPNKVEDPYTDYSELDLRVFLANYRMATTSPGYAYSTLDVGLLGYLLGQAYATNYAKLLSDKILLPLGLKHTGFDDSSALLAGHARGQAAAHWHFSALAGSAGLRSTTDDLLQLLQYNLLPEDSPLRAAILLARQPRAQLAVEEIGLGWNIVQVSSPLLDANSPAPSPASSSQTWPVVWRGSSTAGFSTFIGFRTDRQQALVLLGNSDASLSALGMALLKGDAPPPVPSVHASQPTPEQLAVYPGLYQVRGGVEITVRQRDAQLSAQLSGQPAALLRADSEDVFDADADGFAISFQREAGKVTTLLLNRGGVNLVAQRLSERAPHVARASIPVDAKTLLDYAGDYRLDANALARITLRENKLSLQLSGRAPQPLLAFARDHFACDDDSCTLAFQRDEASRVTSVRLDFAGTEGAAPRVRWATP